MSTLNTIADPALNPYPPGHPNHLVPLVGDRGPLPGLALNTNAYPPGHPNLAPRQR
jgi:hypothetical protein